MPDLAWLLAFLNLITSLSLSVGAQGNHHSNTGDPNSYSCIAEGICANIEEGKVYHHEIKQALFINDGLAAKISHRAAKQFQQGATTFTDFTRTPSKTESQASERQSALKAGQGQDQDLKKYWDGPWKEIEVCDDSCFYSTDGSCSDGRKGFGEKVLCDLGTDCGDCGPWTFLIRESESAIDIPKPIKALQAKEIEVRADHSLSKPPLMTAYTDPTKDVDVSFYLSTHKIVEQGMTQAMHVAMRNRCISKEGERQIFLDIGANFGWYSFYAAAHGCRVIAWEPVPDFRNFLIYGQQLNHQEDMIHVRDRVISSEAGLELNLTIPQAGIWGTASVDSMNIDGAVIDPNRTSVTVTSERVDDVYQGDALVAKIDVEGFEPQVLQSMRGIFDNFRIQNIFLEYSPGVYERFARWSELFAFPSMLAYIISKGLRMAHIDDFKVRGRDLMKGDEEWNGTLPALPEITMSNLAYDLVDIYRQNQDPSSACISKELLEANNKWQSCRAIPEGLHPKSFKSSFGYNTNIWATLESGNIEILSHNSVYICGWNGFATLSNFLSSPPALVSPLLKANFVQFNNTASIFPLHADPGIWYVPPDAHLSSRYGLGGRKCNDAAPEFAIRTRCRCKHSACRKEAEILDDILAKSGPMTFGEKERLQEALTAMQ